MSECCATPQDVILLACSGGSNVGQISNEAAKSLDQLGQGRMYCAIGIGAGIESFIETVRQADACVAIDGCNVACLKKALENAGLTPDVYLVVTDYGIEKGHHFEITREQIAEVADAAVKALAECAKGAEG